jgi:hypothetical protein
MRVWQAMRRRWRQLVSEAHDAVVAEAVFTAVLTAAVVAAAPTTVLGETAGASR